MKRWPARRRVSFIKTPTLSLPLQGEGDPARPATSLLESPRSRGCAQPPSRFLTASFTRLPSAGLPVAASAASAAFNAEPMSYIETAPDSATASSTAAAMSASLASAGK